MSKLVVQPDPYGNRLTNASDVNLRYNESLIMYDGIPCLVDYVPTGMWERVGLLPFNTKTGKFSEKKTEINILTDKKISTDFNLGWVPVGRNPQDRYSTPRAMYYERIPTRRYKQGLCGSNVLAFHPTASLQGGEITLRSNSCHVTMIAIAMSNEVPDEYNLSGLSNPQRISNMIESIMIISKDKNLADEEVFALYSNVSMAMSKKVALVHLIPPKLRKRLKDDKDILFSILVEKQTVGTFNPRNMDIQLNHPGLFSIIQDDLIQAELIH
jgi:hypothetical protein